MGDHSARVTMTVPADRNAVWRAFTEPDALASWFWPPRFATVTTMDARPGGAWSIRSAPTAMGASGAVIAADAPSRLVLAWRWDGEDDETQVSVALSDAGDAAGAGTVVSVTHDGFASGEAAADHVEGWQDCLARLVTLADSQRSL